MFSALFSMDGVTITIRVTGDDIEIHLSDYAQEAVSISATNAQLLASALFAAVHEIENGEA